MKKILLLVGLIFISSNVFCGNFDWMSNIDSSCNATISGRANNFFSKNGFWFDTDVSMKMWADSMRTDNPQDYCYIDYGPSSGYSNKVKLMQCLEYIQHNWDWYSRCMPVVDRMSMIEANGGRK